jgi:hypothetical protein
MIYHVKPRKLTDLYRRRASTVEQLTLRAVEADLKKARKTIRELKAKLNEYRNDRKAPGAARTIGGSEDSPTTGR